ncbi:MAG: FkbM family methyltransferase [Flavobacterium sp.]|nr:FkbM family methyltransferase [Flavobacterium sp.]
MIARIKKAIKILINYEKKVPVNPEQLLQYHRVKPWFAINGDQTLRLNYDLNKDSLVFDVGGYKGEFASDILCKYNANVYVFEPVKAFFHTIEEKFSHNPKVKAYHFGLGKEDCKLQISLSDNSSSVFLESQDTESIQLVSADDFLKSNNVTQVDLIKINIEGGEYELLEALLDHGNISIFKNIQVQFHDFLFENAQERMNKIQDRLSETHELTYQYEFVWENWKLK